MDKRTFVAVQKLMQSGKHRVPISKVWSNLIEQEGIGQIENGKQVVFTPKELKQLRATVNRHVKGDVMHAPVSGTRIEMAQFYSDEKYADQKVFGGMVWACRKYPSPIPLLSGEAITPIGAFISFPLSELDIDHCQLLIVIENGEVFRAWHQLQLPDQCDSALIVYRGHNSNQNAVKELVNQVNRKGKTIGYFDYDPAGFCLAKEIGVSSVLLPADWRQHHRSHPVGKQYNKDESFAVQEKQLKSKLDRLYGGESCVAEAILNGEWSLTQEHMLVHHVPLELFEL